MTGQFESLIQSERFSLKVAEQFGVPTAASFDEQTVSEVQLELHPVVSAQAAHDDGQQ